MPLRSILLTLWASLLAGCATAPIEGERLIELKRNLRAARAAPALVTSIGPHELEQGGDESEIVMPFLSHGEKITEFVLYDAYWKLAFTTADELRALGIPASLSTALWTARTSATAFALRALPDDTVEKTLVQTGIQEEIGAIWRLKPAERRDLLASRLVLISARSGLPARVLAKDPKVSARAIHDAWFGPLPGGRRPLSVGVEGVTLEVASEDGPGGGERMGRARLRIRLLDGDRRLTDREYGCDARIPGSEVRYEKAGGRYTLQTGADDPLDRAIRGCVRLFARDLVAVLRARK